MGKRKMRILGVAVVALLGIVGMAAKGHATCFANCDGSRNTMMNHSAIGSQSNDYRVRSHNFGDNSIAIMGDVYNRVGHERLDMTVSGKNNFVDNSINTPIIIGGNAR